MEIIKVSNLLKTENIILNLREGEFVKYLTEPKIAFGISKEGFKWYFKENPSENKSLDGELVYIVYFQMAKKGGDHIPIIAEISRLIRNDDFAKQFN